MDKEMKETLGKIGKKFVEDALKDNKENLLSKEEIFDELTFDTTEYILGRIDEINKYISLGLTSLHNSKDLINELEIVLEEKQNE